MEEKNEIAYSEYVAEKIDMSINYTDYFSITKEYVDNQISNERKDLYEKRNRIIKKLLKDNE